MIPLTLLYAPGDRIELVEKAMTGPADVVIIDLEDAVALAAKEAARRDVAELLKGSTRRPLQVRINAPGTQWHPDDMEMLAGLPGWVEARVPKVESAAQAREVLTGLAGRPFHALLETPLALERAYEIAASGVASVALGESDLRSALGVATTDHLAWQRSRLVNAAAAAGLPPPSMSVYPSVTDLHGLRASCLAGKALGFVGRAAVHPRQLAVIREVFMPTKEEAARARAVLAGFVGASNAGAGTYVLPNGDFIDVAMVKAAELVVELTER